MASVNPVAGEGWKLYPTSAMEIALDGVDGRSENMEVHNTLTDDASMHFSATRCVTLLTKTCLFLYFYLYYYIPTHTTTSSFPYSCGSFYPGHSMCNQ